jgi:hypothetical protein
MAMGSSWHPLRLCARLLHVASGGLCTTNPHGRAQSGYNEHCRMDETPSAVDVTLGNVHLASSIRLEANSHESDPSSMKTSEAPTLWVVYKMKIHGKTTTMNAVCEQQEWDTMERLQPGHHTLVQAGIINEGEAERLARTPPLVDGEPVASSSALRKWGR